MQNLRDDFPALHFDSCQNAPLAITLPAGFLGVISRVNSRHLVVKMQSRKSTRCLNSTRTTNGRENLTNMPDDHIVQSLDEEKAALLAAASGLGAPSESTLPAVSDMSRVDGPKRSVFRVREPCCFIPLNRDFDEFPRVIRQVLWKSYIQYKHFRQTS